MGFTPDQVWAMSFWEFGAAWAGWRLANSAPSGPDFPTAEQHAANLAGVTIH
jgi:hypothetical protein